MRFAKLFAALLLCAAVSVGAAFSGLAESTCSAHAVRMEHGCSCTWDDTVVYAAIDHTDDPEYDGAVLPFGAFPYTICCRLFSDGETRVIKDAAAKRMEFFEDEGLVYLAVSGPLEDGAIADRTDVYALGGGDMPPVLSLSGILYPEAVYGGRLYWIRENAVLRAPLGGGIQETVLRLDDPYSRIDTIPRRALILSDGKLFLSVERAGEYRILSVDLETKEESAVCTYTRSWFDESKGLFVRGPLPAYGQNYDFILFGGSVLTWDTGSMATLKADLAAGTVTAETEDILFFVQVTESGYLARRVPKEEAADAVKSTVPPQMLPGGQNCCYRFDETCSASVTYMEQGTYLMEANGAMNFLRIDGYRTICTVPAQPQ